MDTSSAVRIVIGAVLIAIGLPLFALARYFSAPGDKKNQMIRSIKIIAITWVSVGVLLYIVVLFTSLNSVIF
jgi:ABC-type lipoprotein release transport system permease subunit